MYSPARPSRFRLRLRGPFLLASVLVAGSAATLQAQVPDSAPADTTPQAVDRTAEYLEAQARSRDRVPVMPRVEPAGPRPPFSRMVFTRDSIEWAGAGTLADLLDQVPGVFIWRAGWVLEPEMASYRGRGATSVEYILDGQPMIPVGPDSVGVDPARLVLGMLDRVEIERWPDVLRVYAYTRAHDGLAPSSRLAIGTGSRSIARYQGTFEKRWRSGIGLGLGADFLNLPTGSFDVGDRLQTEVWAQLSYVPSARMGLQYQLFGSDVDRDPVRRITGDTLAPALDGARRDQQLKFFWRRRPDGTGLRTDLSVGRTSWNGSGVEQSTINYSARLSHRSATRFLSGTVGGSSRWTPLEVRGQVGWAPGRALSAGAEGAYQQHDGGRTSAWLGLRAGVGLPMGMDLTAAGRLGRLVAAPAVASDTAQDLAELDVTLGLRRRTVDLALTLSHTSSFAPRAFQPYRIVDSLRPADATEWVSVTGRLRPVPWLTVDGWFSHAVGLAPDGQPATHGMARITFRSKFLRVFPSGIFDLKAQVGLETWGAGSVGIDSLGTVVGLSPGTFFTGFIQLELGGFRAFYERRNLAGTRSEYLPGFTIPAFASVFGVRWDFLN